MPKPPINPMAGKTANLPSYLRRKGALVSVNLDVQANTKAAKQVGQEEFSRTFFTIQDRAGRELANAAKEAMGRLLMVGGEPDIGVTGAASENLFIRSVDRVQKRGGEVTEVVWYVYEGDKTRANKAIRKGVRPHPSKWTAAIERTHSKMQSGSRSAGASQIQGGFLGALSVWAKKRGLRPEMSIMGIKARPSKSRSYARLQHYRRKTPWESMIWALWHSMQIKGTSMNYQERFGTSFYDYVARVTGGKNARGKGGSSNSTFRQSIQSRMERGGEVWENVQRVTADYVYTMVGRIGNRLVSGRVQGRSLGVNQFYGRQSDIGFEAPK